MNDVVVDVVENDSGIKQEGSKVPEWAQIYFKQLFSVGMKSRFKVEITIGKKTSGCFWIFMVHTIVVCYSLQKEFEDTKGADRNR